MELSRRLQAVANLVPKVNVAADIGCDHGYVAIWLVEEKICTRVIAMDVNKGPLERAKQNIEAHCLSDYIETRLSNGAEKLTAGEADTLICAGMGGKLTIGILERSLDKVKAMSGFVIQPQSDLREVRKFIREQGFSIAAEDMILEDEKFYPMMQVVTKPEPAMSTDVTTVQTKTEISDWEQEMQDTYGPLLLQQAHPVLKIYLEKQMDVLSGIIEDLRQKADAERGLTRVQELESKRENMQKLLTKYFLL